MRQPQAIPKPHNRPPPQLNGEVAVLSPRDIPQELAYRLFLLELAAMDRAADSARAAGKNDAPLRNYFQGAFGLDPAEFQRLLAAARLCASLRERNRQSIGQTVQALRLSPQDAQLRSRLEQLHRDNQAAVLGPVEQLRAELGPRRFAWLDQQVRRHVAANLKIYRKRAGAPTGPGGR